MKTAEELLKDKIKNESICLIDDSPKVLRKRADTVYNLMPSLKEHPLAEPKEVIKHPYALPTKTFEEVKTEKLNNINFLTNISMVTRNINKIWKSPEPTIVAAGNGYQIAISRNSRNFTVTEHEVSSQGDTDEHLKDIMELYIEAQRAKYEAAGKLAEFDIAKLSFKAVGNKADRLTELCRQRGIGVALHKQEPVKASTGLVDTTDNNRPSL